MGSVLTADYVYNQNTGGVTLNSTGLAGGSGIASGPIQFNLANQRAYGSVCTFQISSVSSLTSGAIWYEMFDDLSQTWIKAPQEVYLTASGGGTPQVIDGNNAAATAIVGGSARNCSGITNINNTMTCTLVARVTGKLLRLNGSAASGSATLTFDERGLTAI